jgi:hypothetical protein
MSWGNDLVTILVNAGYGVYNTNIGLTSKWSIPSGNGPYTSIIETGGTGAVRTQNSAPQAAYRRPGASITIRAISPTIAKAKAELAYVLFAGVKNTYVNGVWYVEIVPLQEPFDMQTDDVGRQLYTFNVLGFKRPY